MLPLKSYFLFNIQSSAAYLTAINDQAAVRDFLASFINNISISGVDSILQQAAMLYQLSLQINQITRNTAVRPKQYIYLLFIRREISI